MWKIELLENTGWLPVRGTLLVIFLNRYHPCEAWIAFQHDKLCPRDVIRKAELIYWKNMESAPQLVEPRVSARRASRVWRKRGECFAPLRIFYFARQRAEHVPNEAQNSPEIHQNLRNVKNWTSWKYGMAPMRGTLLVIFFESISSLWSLNCLPEW